MQPVKIGIKMPVKIGTQNKMQKCAIPLIQALKEIIFRVDSHLIFMVITSALIIALKWPLLMPRELIKIA